MSASNEAYVDHYLTELSRPVRARRVFMGVTAFVVAMALSMPFDHAVYHHYKPIDTGDTDWHRLLRILGYVPTWLLAAGAFLLIDTKRAARLGWGMAVSRVGLVLFSVIGSGVLAELLKLLIRRIRPDDTDGVYAFMPWAGQWWQSGDLGLPSSHTAIAFAGMGILAHLYPRAAVVFIAMACGTAATRFMNHTHFVSDTAFAAVLGLLTARAVWHDHVRRHRLDPRQMVDRPFE